ncbi:MAG TPA: potassium-transporting ATPase subunit KdpC [Polyangiaceae bacterium]|nr:potassium-transporting ATPase subunit KdpC [Polyangiaceae bacterium]
MMNIVVVALRTTLFTLVLTGLIYPLGMTGISQLLFPAKASGSLLEHQGKIVGSELIGQAFANPAYFQSRPSAAGQNGFDATASSGSNLGPTSNKLKERVLADVERLKKENPNAEGPVPDALVTASGSGLDPHLSPEAAAWQVARIAKARNIAYERVASVLDAQIEGREMGVLGEPKVNLLVVNLALDHQFGAPAPVPPPPSTPADGHVEVQK